MSEQDWPDYDGQGDEDALPPQQGDDEDEMGVPELRRELLQRAPQIGFLQSFLTSAMGWLDDEESTEVMLAACNLLEANLQLYRGSFGDIMSELRDALSHDQGEDLLYVLLRLVKELQRA